MNPELLCKYLDNTTTNDELKQVLDWLDADPANRSELDRMDKVFAAAAIHGQSVLPQAVAKPTRSTPWKRIARYAAQAAAVLMVGYGLAWVLTENRIGKWAQQTTTLEVPVGHYMSLKLQDGTTVWLNSGAKLEYPAAFARGERRVKISGEAMFDVEHDAEHPFIVETFACDVEVLGTKFNVIAEEQENCFAAALLRGSVKVSNRLTPGEVFVLKPNEEAHLMGNHLFLETIDNPDEYLWTQGMISIKGLSFGELMCKFEKYFGVKIILECDRMPTINYNHGKIRMSDGVDSALRLLQLSADFTYTRNADNDTIVIR